MHVGWTFTGDGVITLAVGLLAFVGVIITILCSSRNLREETKAAARNLKDQLGAESAARQNEVRRQRLAIASALIAEIVDFRKSHVEAFESMCKEGMNVKILDRRFHVYESNTARIGELGSEACESVVHFYDRAFEYLGALERYYEMEHEEPCEGESRDEKRNRAEEFFKHSIYGRFDELKASAVKAEKALLRVKSTIS